MSAGAIDLAAAAEGSTAEDSTGDVWTKENGVWVCFDARMSNESLIHVWGPITLQEATA